MEGVQAYMHLLQERQDTVLGVEPYLDKEVQGLVLHILHILHIQVPLEEDPQVGACNFLEEELKRLEEELPALDQTLDELASQRYSGKQQTIQQVPPWMMKLRRSRSAESEQQEDRQERLEEEQLLTKAEEQEAAYRKQSSDILDFT